MTKCCFALVHVSSRPVIFNSMCHELARLTGYTLSRYKGTAML